MRYGYGITVNEREAIVGLCFLVEEILKGGKRLFQRFNRFQRFKMFGPCLLAWVSEVQYVSDLPAGRHEFQRFKRLNRFSILKSTTLQNP